MWLGRDLRLKVNLPIFNDEKTKDVVTYCYSGAIPLSPGTLGNLTSHLCWAWLAGSGWGIHARGYLIRERSHFSLLQHLLYNIIINTSNHHTSTQRLTYSTWLTPLQLLLLHNCYTSVPTIVTVSAEFPTVSFSFLNLIYIKYVLPESIIAFRSFHFQISGLNQG